MRTHRPPKKSSEARNPWLVYITLVLLAAASALGLDYMNWRKGEKSYLFATLPDFGQEKPSPKKISLGENVKRFLVRMEIPEASVSLYRDDAGRGHMKVDMTLDQYKRLEAGLLLVLKEAEARLTKEEEQEDKIARYFLWEVEGPGEQETTLLFSCLKEAEAPPEKPAHRVALIMDDMGNSLEAILDLVDIGVPITVAILPDSPLARETAQIAHQNGLEVLLHLPLESINSDNGGNNMPGIIRTGMSPEEIRGTVERHLDQVPYAVGANNHMGSKITQDEAMMEIILRRLKDRGFFFIDSRTTGNSIAYDVARKLRIPAAERNVFLDGEVEEGYITRKLGELFTVARKNGQAIGICHPFFETLKVLRKEFVRAKEYGLEPVFVSELVR